MAIPAADCRLIAAYEELRSQAIQGCRQGPGLALLTARGFRCWMEVCHPLLAPESSKAQAPEQPETGLPAGLRGELVVLLASMLLQQVSKEAA